MANFNFNSLAETSFTSDSQSYLKPYDIYKVKLTKAEKGELKGSKDPNAVYQIVALEFSGEQGIFTTNLFIPNRDEDFDQNENPTTHKIQPSNWDRFYMTLLQILEVLNPTSSEKFKKLAKEGKIKDVDTFIKVVVPAIASVVNKEDVYLKLVGRNSNGTVYADLPTSCWFDMSTSKVKPLNFIAKDEKKLSFSNWEIQKMKEYKEAKPTNMSAVDNTPDAPADEINLDDIEI